MRWPAIAVVPPWPGSGEPASRPGPRAQVGGVGAADDDRPQPDARDAQLGDRLAVAARAGEGAGGHGGARAVAGVARGGELERAQLRGEAVLGAAGAQRAERLLPGERDGRVGQDEQPGDDQRGAERAPHRRSADSVPPSEPGPA